MDYLYTVGSDGELYHWGIKGMKWGQRRYQNKDGSLTPAGKKRYAKEEAALKEREKAIKGREKAAAKKAKLDAKKAELDAREEALKGPGKKDKAGANSEAPKQKSIKDMSNDELRELTERMNLEKNFYEARSNLARANPKPQTVIDKMKDKYLDDIVKSVVMEPAKQYVSKQLGKKLGLDEKDPLKVLENKWKKADYEKKIAEAERDAKKAKKPDGDKPNWDDIGKQQNYLQNRQKTEQALIDYQKWLEGLSDEDRKRLEQGR